MVLCIPCFETDDIGTQFMSIWKRSKKYMRVLVFRPVQQFASVLFIYLIFRWMFDLKWNIMNTYSVELKMSNEDCNQMVEFMLPFVVGALFIYIPFQSLVLSGKQHRRMQFIHVAFCVICIGVMAFPMLALTPNLSEGGFFGSSAFGKLWFKARMHRVINSYGLFRRMTGVGEMGTQEHSEFNHETGPWGWGGLPPSIVERPELILEGLIYRDNVTEMEWRELKFRWKPGDVMVSPKQVAPHQPR